MRTREGIKKYLLQIMKSKKRSGKSPDGFGQFVKDKTGKSSGRKLWYNWIESPEFAEAELLAEYLEIPVTDILLGTKERELIVESTDSTLGVVTIEEDKPYYGNLMAIGGIGALENNPDNIHPTDNIRVPNSGADFYIPIFGDSMYPKYCAGETVGLKKIDKDFVMFGHAYVVELTNGEAFIKYIRKGRDEEHWVLASENPKYEPREFHLSNIRGVYMIKVILTKTSIT